MGKIPTVKVKADTELGYMIINQVDFIEKEHELVKADSSDELTEEEILEAPLEELKLPQLRMRAEARGIENVSRTKRNDLIIAITEAENEGG
ncbi:MAG: Rho termination factor N-terminal domain-containing protein [Spirochaetota bacterium]